MSEWRLFPEGTIPECTTPEWYDGRERAPHLEQRAHRARLLYSAGLVGQAAMNLGLPTVVDLGAGDGGLLSLVSPLVKAWGYDLQNTNVAAASERGVDLRYGDVLGDIEWGQIAVTTEMLEHLVDPHAFVRRVAEHATAIVASSPWTERPGNAYEFHTWAWDPEGYAALIRQGGFKVVHHALVGGFQVVLGVKQ